MREEKWAGCFSFDNEFICNLNFDTHGHLNMPMYFKLTIFFYFFFLFLFFGLYIRKVLNSWEGKPIFFFSQMYLKTISVTLQLWSVIKKTNRIWCTRLQCTDSSASGTPSRMNGPSFPVLNNVRNFFDIMVRASEALCGIFSAFCSASNCWSIRFPRSLSSSRFPLNSVRVV